MTNGSLGLRHIHKRKKRGDFPHKNKFKSKYDKFMLVVSVLVPLVNLPQLFKIFLNQDASGVSLISWFFLSIFSFFWIIYGVLHKDKPIFFMHLFLFFIQIAITVGTFIY